MNEVDFLLWVRGPGLAIASIIFVFGMILKMFEIFMLGRKKNLAELRSSGIREGFRTIITRSGGVDISSGHVYSDFSAHTARRVIRIISRLLLACLTNTHCRYDYRCHIDYIACHTVSPHYQSGVEIPVSRAGLHCLGIDLPAAVDRLHDVSPPVFPVHVATGRAYPERMCTAGDLPVYQADPCCHLVHIALV